MRVVSLGELKGVCANAKGNIDNIYMHWSAGHYGQFFDDYHIMIDYNGDIMLMHEDLEKLLAHTWRRNTGAIGIAICGCYGAQANQGYNTNFGAEPPTDAQIEMLAKVINLLSEELDILLDENYIMTHEEIATIDGYGPGSMDPQTRWDLWYLKDYDGEMKHGGNVIRGKALWCQQQY